ncbi:dockerin type I repeat-containing protein [Candidatus Micrarchaeota archaeon]|nr:dockerin type I repeat-containing protein [Candidatus Micrarchaeota archaeon]MBU2475867.1 dockerin type I repeat-containing protein [Candidatus Micrarchaeota archaeon]
MNKKILFGVLSLFLILALGGCILNPNDSTGGAVKNIGTKTTGKPAIKCVEDWSCSQWSECVNGSQTRTCIDSAECGTTEFKPAETQSCTDENSSCTTPTNGMNLDYTYQGQTITLCPGTYNLPNGIYINGNNITLDCQGTAVLDGSGTYDESIWYTTHAGILLAGRYSIVKNCQLRNYLKGIEVSGEEVLALNNKIIGTPQETTEIELKEGNIYYKDADAGQHTVPFYVMQTASDESTGTFEIDGQTIWYKINLTDLNEADGNITFRENTSSGQLLYNNNYTDEDYSQTLRFKGSNAFPTYTYNLMVDEIGSTARVWLFFQTFPSYAIIETEYGKSAWFGGTDTDEDGEINFNFYLPHSQYLPVAMGGDINFDMNNNYVGIWVIDENGDNAYDAKAFIDTGTGNLIALPNIALNYYSYEADYLDYGMNYEPPVFIHYVSENPASAYPSSAYTRFGSFVELNNHHYKITIPENEQNTIGIYTDGDRNSTISKNYSYGNMAGIKLISGYNSRELKENTFCNNFQADIVCENTRYTTTEGDTCDTTAGETDPIPSAECGFTCSNPCPNCADPNSYVCGDTDFSGNVDIDDVIYAIAYIYMGGNPPVPQCSANVNGDSMIDVDDVVYLIDYIFTGGPAPDCSPVTTKSNDPTKGMALNQVLEILGNAQ